MVRIAVGFIFEILQTVVLSAAIFVIIYLFAAQPHLVRGASMEPNFHNGDYILTEKVSYRFKNPDRGEVIVFKAPNKPDSDYIKRIIALPGEKVKIIQGTIFINGLELAEPYEPADFETYSGKFLQENQDFTIPEGKYFVLGDNRSHSSDSREFGPIEKGSIVGRALVRYWPLPQMGILSTPKYALALHRSAP